MSNIHRSLLPIFVLALTLSIFPVSNLGGRLSANELTLEQDARNRINFAARQRMLTQQIARNACFVMADIDPDRFAAKTEATVRQFDSVLVGLHEGDETLGLMRETNPDILAALRQVESLWKTLGPASRQIAAGDVHPVPMQQLIRLNLLTNDEMDGAVQKILSNYTNPAMPADLVRTINLAGRQRMLSQKASKEICFRVLDISGDGASGNIDETIATFDTVMQQLLEGSQNAGVVEPPNRQVKKQLERTRKAWESFKEIVASFEPNGQLSTGDRVKLANLSDQVLREMDLAVWMYAE